MNVEVVIPWQGNDPDRVRALWWVRRTLKWSGKISTLDADQPWCKALAVRRVVESSKADILVVHDADVICHGLDEAIAQVEAGVAWAVPHDKVYRLTRESTDEFIFHGLSRVNEIGPLAQSPYRGYAGGGIVVIRKDVYEGCPLDSRFVGWGQEDSAWSTALETLHGPPWRGDAPLFHLWHEPQPRMNRRFGSAESKILMARYREASRDPAKMRDLISEIPAMRTTLQSEHDQGE